MDILPYILSCLRQNEKVGVLGLGTFIKSARPAVVTEGLIAPPRSEVSFERRITESELLIREIASAQSISATEAKELVYKFSNGVLGTLHKTGSYKLGPLGAFAFTNNEILFTAAEDERTFGLPKIPVTTAPPKQQSAENGIAEPAADEQHISEEVTEDKRRSKLPFILAGLLAVIIIGALVIYYNKKQQTAVPASQPYNSTSVNTDTAKKDTLVKAADTSTRNTATQADTAISFRKPYYSVIGAAIQSKAKTDVFINQMQKIGIDAKINSAMPGRLHKVSLGDYQTRMEADSALARFKMQTHIQGLYIYTNK